MEGKEKVGVTEKVCLEDWADGGKARDRRLERGCHRAMGDGFTNMVLDELSHLGKSPRPQEKLSISPRAVVPKPSHLSQSPESFKNIQIPRPHFWRFQFCRSWWGPGDSDTPPG